VPAALLTDTAPVLAVAGTTAVIEVVLRTVKRVALTPPNFTPVVAVIPEKFAPVIVMVSPVFPLVAESELIDGGIEIEKLERTVTVPPAVVTVTAPVVAPAGTVMDAEVPHAPTATLVAATPVAKVTWAPKRLLPEIVKVEPTEPEVVLAVLTTGASGLTIVNDTVVAIGVVVTESEALTVAT
jgi:hypothetical protein